MNHIIDTNELRELSLAELDAVSAGVVASVSFGSSNATGPVSSSVSVTATSATASISVNVTAAIPGTPVTAASGIFVDSTP